MFGNGFHARIGAVILPASSSGCEWYSLRSFNMALAHGMALLLHCIALLLSTGLAQDHAKRTDAFGAEDFVALRDRARRSDVLGAEGFAAL